MFVRLIFKNIREFLKKITVLELFIQQNQEEHQPIPGCQTQNEPILLTHESYHSQTYTLI